MLVKALTYVDKRDLVEKYYQCNNKCSQIHFLNEKKCVLANRNEIKVRILLLKLLYFGFHWLYCVWLMCHHFYFPRYAMALYNQHVCPVDNW